MNEPLLSNPPAFVLLVLVFAVAAYLRQVNEAAAALYNQIRFGDAPVYPIGAVHTNAKLDSLKATRRNIEKRGPLVVRLTLVLAFRYVLQALIPLLSDQGAVARIDTVLRWLDLGILLWLFIVLSVLAWLHKKARERDARLQELFEAYMDANSAASV